ncbi:MAG: flagellin [Candidatus Melainabacteria bacterium]
MSVLNTNIPSLIAQYRLNFNTQQVERSFERLSSGKRINHTSDDAAGLSISQNLVGQIKRMNVNLRNVQDGISMIQIAEGALSTSTEILQRVRELTVQAANDTYDNNSRNAAEGEIRSLLAEMDRIALSTQFNGIHLLDGSIGVTSPSAFIQIGPDTPAQTNVLDLTPNLADTGTGDPLNGPAGAGIGLFSATTTFADSSLIDFTSNLTTQSFMDDIDAAMRVLTQRRSLLGASQKQLESITDNLTTSIENSQASNSRIVDLDIAQESATLNQYQVLQNAAVTVLAQTNRLPQMIMSLLQQN